MVKFKGPRQCFAGPLRYPFLFCSPTFLIQHSSYEILKLTQLVIRQKSDALKTVCHFVYCLGATIESRNESREDVPAAFTLISIAVSATTTSIEARYPHQFVTCRTQLSSLIAFELKPTLSSPGAVPRPSKP